MNKLYKLIFLLLFCSLSQQVKAQMIYIPDTMFRNSLAASGYGSCISGNYIDASCPLVTQTTSLNFSFMFVNDISGVEAFTNLQRLIVYQMDITSLPILPASLRYLEITRSSSLSSIPAFPPDLDTLIIQYCTSISSIPPFPLTLKILDFASCFFLTSLPALPDSLISLNCRINGLTVLPPLPPYLERLDASNNFLINLPPIPFSVTYLDCSGNPDLSCLPLLRDSLDYLTFGGTNISCIQKHYYSASGGFLPNFPVCGMFNQNNCTSYSNISGKVFLDADSNCVINNSEAGLKDIKVSLYSNRILFQETYTNKYGEYAFITNGIGNFETKIDVSSLPLQIECPLSFSYKDTLTAVDTVRAENNFALKCVDNDLGAWSVSSTFFRAATPSTIYVRAGAFIQNCASAVSGTVAINFSGPVNYLQPAAGALTPSSVVGNTLTYSVNDFGLIDNDKAFNFIVIADTNATINDSVCFSLSVTSSVIESNLTNNDLHLCTPITGSFDPNDKTAYPKDYVLLSADSWLTYTIRFQNTGTAEAYNIYVLDTLDTELDLSSFTLMATSHPCEVQILPGRIARFNFRNINLPDSTTNEALSHGFIQYKIRLNDVVPSGADIENAAHIYFDFNPAITTNTTVNNFVVTSLNEIKNTEIYIAPNPFKDEIRIETNGYEIFSLNVYDVIGKLILSQSHFGKSILNTSYWNKGMYFVRLENSKTSSVKKIIKE